MSLEGRDQFEDIVRYEDGRYVGQLRGNTMHGKGKFTSWDGESYEGEFRVGKRHGQGEYLYSNGQRYDGGRAPPEREHGITGPWTDVYSMGQLLWHMLTNEKPGIISEERILRRLEELGHPEWLGELINQSVVPHSTEDRIQTVAEFRIRLKNQGELL